MNKHYLDASDEIEAEELRTLPDRSGLSLLYPEATRKRDDAARRVRGVNSDILAVGNVSKTIGLNALIVGSLTPLPFIVAMAVFVFFEVIINAGNIIALLPAITISVIVWAVLSMQLYHMIAEKLDQLRVNQFSFLGFCLGCLALLALPLYEWASVIDVAMLAQVVFFLVIIISSIILGWVFLYLALNTTMSDRTKMIITVAIVMVSGLALVVYLTRASL